METAIPVEYTFRYTYFPIGLFEDRSGSEEARRKTFKKVEDNEVVTYSNSVSLKDVKHTCLRYGLEIEELSQEHNLFKRYGPKIIVCKRIPKDELKKMTEVIFDPSKLTV